MTPDNVAIEAGRHLSAEQKRQFIRDGFLAVPGLVPQENIERGLNELRDETGLVPDAPDTWDEQVNGNLAIAGYDVRFHVVTEKVRGIAAELGGHGLVLGDGLPILNRPEPDRSEAGGFAPRGAHVDGVRKGLSLYPELYRIAILAYLTPARIGGGAFVAWPGSHRLAFEHYAQSTETIAEACQREQTMYPPGPDYADPVPVPGEAGDVVFFHYLLIHGGSFNYHDHVRVAANLKAKDPKGSHYEPKPGPPRPDWTPLDWTLRTDTLPQLTV